MNVLRYPQQRSPTFLAPGTGFVESKFSTDGGVGMVQAVMRVMGRNGEQQMKLCWLACLPLTSCCAARFLTGRALGLVCGLELGIPELANYLKHLGSFFWPYKWLYFHSPFLQMLLFLKMYTCCFYFFIFILSCVSNQAFTSTSLLKLFSGSSPEDLRGVFVLLEVLDVALCQFLDSFLESLSSSCTPRSTHFPKPSPAISCPRC